MANYFTPTVIRPSLPESEVSPLTLFILTAIFEYEKHDGKIRFFSRTGHERTVSLDSDELQRVTKVSEQSENGIERGYTLPVSDIHERDGDSDLVEIEFDMDFIYLVLRDVVLRSPSIDRIEMISSFTCDRMREDGFGGSAAVITADEIKYFSTHDFLKDT